MTETYLQINLSLRTCEVIANPIIAQTICANSICTCETIHVWSDSHTTRATFSSLIWFREISSAHTHTFFVCKNSTWTNERATNGRHEIEKNIKKKSNINEETINLKWNNERAAVERSTGTSDKWQNGEIGHFHRFKWHKRWCAASDKIC